MSALSIQTIRSALTDIKRLPVAKQDALPQGFPVMIKGSAVWFGSDFANNDDFVYNLSGPEKCEIRQGLDAFKGMYNHPFFSPPPATKIPLLLLDIAPLHPYALLQALQRQLCKVIT